MVIGLPKVFPLVKYVKDVCLERIIRHFLNLIDDLSRFTWVYFLKNNNIFFEMFKEFRAFAEKKCDQPIK
jgi:hypothetical protein